MNKANYEHIMNNLRKYTSKEMFCREYQNVRNDPVSLEFFFKKNNHEKELIWKITHQDQVSHNMQEEEFIDKSSNVRVMKNERYVPPFYHSHTFFEMFYVASGKCIQYIDDKSVTFQQGDIFILAPGVRHGIYLEDDDILINVLIRQSTFQEIFNSVIQHQNQLALFFISSLYQKDCIQYILFHTAGDEKILEYIMEMYAEQFFRDEYSDNIICHLLSIFFVYLTRTYRKTSEIPKHTKKITSFEDKILHYILTNYRTVSLNELARYFYISESHCSRLIREITQMNFSDFLFTYRMQKGQTMLKNNSWSVAEISDKLGYSNPETFIRAFKRFSGMTPAQYRKISR